MALRYFVYVASGFLYAYAFLLLAGLASAIGNLPAIGFVGALILFAMAGGLSLFWPRAAGAVALGSVAMLWPWCARWAIELARSTHPGERWFSPVPCVPVLVVTVLAARSLITRAVGFDTSNVGEARLAMRLLLAVFPLGLVVAWQVWLRART